MYDTVSELGLPRVVLRLEHSISSEVCRSGKQDVASGLKKLSNGCHLGADMCYSFMGPARFMGSMGAERVYPCCWKLEPVYVQSRRANVCRTIGHHYWLSVFFEVEPCWGLCPCSLVRIRSSVCTN